MFDLKALTITNFKSYVGTVTVIFPTKAGLYFFSGKNLVNPSLGANGVGKSTFLDAITWALYGRTTRGVKASDVLPWGSKAGCTVTVTLIVGDQEYRVKRQQKPSGLYLNEKLIDQTELQKHLRLSYVAFLYSVINPQFSQPFLSLLPAAKLTLFSEIMELDYWLLRSSDAEKAANSLADELAELNSRLNRDIAQIDVIKQDIKAIKVEHKKYEDTRAARLTELNLEKANMESLNKEIKHDLKFENLHVSKLNRDIKNFQTDFDTINRYQDNCLSMLTEYNRIQSREKVAKEHFQDIIKSLEEADPHCPTCNQAVDKKDLQRELEINIKFVAGLDKRINIRLKRQKDLIKAVSEYKQKMGTLEYNISELHKKIDDTKANINALQQDMSSNDKDIRRVEGEIAQLTDGENPFTNQLNSKKEKYSKLYETIAANEKLKQDKEALHTGTSYWVKGFKRIRLFVIEQAFRTLEVEVNNSLAQLGMANWQISFDVERETKAGGVTKGFIVFVKSPANEELVRWESWSGGETQRLQLAGALGLANLIMQQNGLVNTTEFYDEPSTHLSAEGMMDLANMLHERALSENKRIWIVDHTAITNFGDFEGTIEVVKDRNGTSLKLDLD